MPAFPRGGGATIDITVSVKRLALYHDAMIRSFKCKHTQALFEGENPRPFRAIKAAAERKLQMLNAAVTLDFLRSPPGNRLEALRGEREGQYSIRINQQWRVCFVWSDDGPCEVEIVDYH
ncbi:MAG TPA: type II toxin-antitoxin system RelE/ParE family toxin [Thiolinea sp.]|nr:type II toxin-antitoxin system RelE/ParE family toxin [Thiolinea sp.]